MPKQSYCNYLTLVFVDDSLARRFALQCTVYNMLRVVDLYRAKVFSRFMIYMFFLGVRSMYCITPIFRVEKMFAIFANLDLARNFPPAKIISTANGISRNFPPAKFYSREIFLPAKIKF